MDDTKQVKSKRDLVSERMKGRHPDKDFADEESFFGQINDDYDEYDRELAGYKEREGKFSEMFTSDPRTARLMVEWRDGRDPIASLLSMYGDELKEALEDPEKREELAEANREYAERVTKEKEYEEEYSRNIAESLSAIEKAQGERGLSDDQVDAAMGWLIGIIRDGVMGKFAPETIDMAVKAQNFDAAMEQAGQEGEVRGRNSRIEEKLRKSQKGDGTASLDGKNGAPGGRRRKTVFDLAGEAM